MRFFWHFLRSFNQIQSISFLIYYPLFTHNTRTITALFVALTEHPQMQNICNKTRLRWSRVLIFYLIRRLLDELLTVLYNDTLVVLIYLNTEEVVDIIIS